MKFLRISLVATTALVTSAYAMKAQMPEGVLLDGGYTLAQEQTFTFYQGDDWGSIDPGLVEDTVGGDAVRQLFEGLYGQDRDGNIIPALAESVTVSNDKLVYVFNLKQGAVWTDGKPVTAHDFEYAWKRVANPETGSQYASYLTLMSLANAQDVIDGKKPVDDLGVIAIDDYMLQVTLDNPIPYFLKTLAHGTTFPVPRWAVEEYGNTWTHPDNIVSNGAYKLMEYRPGEHVIFERNKLYWDDANTVIDKAVQLTINNVNQAYNRYLAGELDIVSVPTGQYPAFTKKHEGEIYSSPILCSYYLSLNQRESGPDYLKDKRVRRALSLVIDRDILVEKVTQAGQIPAYTFTPAATADFMVPYLPEYQELSQAERDEEGRRLMLEAGYGPDNPLEVEYIYNTLEGHKKIAVFVSQMWKQKLGVKTSISNMEWKTLLDTRNAGDYEIARDGWCADYNEASTFLEVFTSMSDNNNGGYSNPIVDKLLIDSKTAENPQTNYTLIEAYMAEDTGFIPIYHYTAPILLKPNVKGYAINNAQNNWWIKDVYKVDAE